MVWDRQAWRGTAGNDNEISNHTPHNRPLALPGSATQLEWFGQRRIPLERSPIQRSGLVKRAARRKGLRSASRHGAAQLRLGTFDARELVVDLFAGGGGTSEGIKAATGRDPDIAINHDPLALAMHEANHPTTKHYCESVFKARPVDVCDGRPVGLLWASPDCTHFSKSKGGKPRSKKIRGLAWVVVRWAHDVRPRVVILENVLEFQGWGPLLENGLPDPKRIGKTFRAFVRKLESYGYRVEWRAMVAADYGVPTTRRRLFLVARCDGQPIEWPAPTRARKQWAPAADVIDWSIPCPSIFDRKEPLSEPTLRRIAVGIWRYVIEPVAPFVVELAGATAIATLITTSRGERKGQAARVPGLEKPIGTITAQGSNHALVAAFIRKDFGSPLHRMRAVGSSLADPLATVTAQDHNALTLAHLERDRRHAAAVVALVSRFDRDGNARVGPPVDVSVLIDGERRPVTDIGSRQLVPRELFNAQGFPPGYVIDPVVKKRGRSGVVRLVRMPKTHQRAKAGNAVNPPLAAALVRANYSEREAVAA